MTERLALPAVPRTMWIGGLVIAAASVAASVVIRNPALLWGVPIGLLLAAFPLLARLDAVELDGERLRVRRGIRWVGPVDLRNLVAFGYRPPTPRSPPVWLLIQREAGTRLRWYWRLNVERDVRTRLSAHRDLRVVEVAAGRPRSEPSALADHLARYVLASDALVEERARIAIDQRRSAASR